MPEHILYMQKVAYTVKGPDNNIFQNVGKANWKQYEKNKAQSTNNTEQ